jgi:IclR family transcriptional regulator, acetate operon repressor
MKVSAKSAAAAGTATAVVDGRSASREPAYPLQSVDNVLQLLMILRRDGHLRVSSAAQELGVARSTAHRLISMLHYHDFVEQAPDRTYYATATPKEVPTVDADAAVIGVARRHLIKLAEWVNETTLLCVLRGTEMECLDSIEAGGSLHVGSRIGVRYSARLTAAGTVMLADLSFHAVRETFAGSFQSEREVVDLYGVLAAARRQGWAAASASVERGVTALAKPLYGSSGRVIASVSIAAPVTRYKKNDVVRLLPGLTRTVEDIRTDLLALAVPARASVDVAPRDVARRVSGRHLTLASESAP